MIRDSDLSLHRLLFEGLRPPHSLDLLDTELEILTVLYYLHLQNRMIIDAKQYIIYIDFL